MNDAAEIEPAYVEDKSEWFVFYVAEHRFGIPVLRLGHSRNRCR